MSMPCLSTLTHQLGGVNFCRICSFLITPFFAPKQWPSPKRWTAYCKNSLKHLCWSVAGDVVCRPCSGWKKNISNEKTWDVFPQVAFGSITTSGRDGSLPPWKGIDWFPMSWRATAGMDGWRTVQKTWKTMWSWERGLVAPSWQRKLFNFSTTTLLVYFQKSIFIFGGKKTFFAA